MRQFSFGISPFTDASFPDASFPGALESGSLAKVGAFLVEGSFALGIDFIPVTIVSVRKSLKST
jgi:hypothetical protein